MVKIDKISFIDFVHLLFIIVILGRGALPEYFPELILACIAVITIIIHKTKLLLDQDITFLYIWIGIYFILNIFVYNQAISKSDLIISILYFIVGLAMFLILKTTLNNNARIINFLLLYIITTCTISIMTVASHLSFLLAGNRSILLYIRHNSARNAGLYGNPNYYAISLLLGIGFLLGLQIFLKMKKSRMLLSFIIFLILTTDLILTYSRGALISYIVMLTIYLMHQTKATWKNRKHKKLLIFILSILLIFVISLGAIVMNQSKGGVVASIIETFSYRINNMFYGSGGGRYAIWLEGWHLFVENPYRILLGMGGNQFSYYSSFGQPTHNGFLKSLYENGLLGLGMLLFLLWYRIKSMIDIKELKIKSPIFLAFVGLIIMGLSNDVFILKEFWLVYSLATIYERTEKTKIII